jgi:uncharacterized protein YndB with AHSA1/START domain
MPNQKDLKRLVRARMQKTGESYTGARLQLLKKVQPPNAVTKSVPPPPDYAALAGMSDETVETKTGRNWEAWVRLLDAANAAEKPHGEIAAYVSSLGTPSWWTQTVTVGYERIRGLRARGQRRDGGYEASKSRTFNVPLERLYRAFADARTRRRWLGVKVTVKSATPEKRMRILWDDGTQVQIGFLAKGASKSAVAIQHEKLPDKAAAEAMKQVWSERFDRLAELFA